ncbi:MAG: translocation/assembly module TamB domain-containing protein [Bacteroidia bacterium]
MIFLVLVIFLLIQQKNVQTYLGQRASAYFSKELNTRISIGSVEIAFFKKVVLEDVYIEDLHHDTLLYSKKLNVDIDALDFEKHQLYVGDVVLLNTKAKLIKYAADDDLNLQFLLDAFKSKDTLHHTSAKWEIRFREVNFVNTDFTYRSEHDTLETTGVNYFDLNARQINGRISNIGIDDDTIHAKIDYLSAVEKSGFVLQNISSAVSVSPVGVTLNDLKLKTPESDISTDLTFKYESYHAFKDFINNVRIKAEFEHSHLELSDIAYFAPELKGIYRNIDVTGKISGKVSDLKGKDMILKLAANTEFIGDFTLTGLPKIDETLIYLNVEKLTTNYRDLNDFPIPPFNEHKTLHVHPNIARLGNMKFKGTFTGLYNDFYAYGDFTSALGGISSDISVRHDYSKDIEIYKGKLKSSSFDFGSFFGGKYLGKVTMNVNVDGSGFTLDEVKAKLAGTVNSVDFMGYTYKNVAVEGNIANKLFKGKLAVKDDNVDFDFIGNVDLSGKLPKLDFITTLNRADLAALHFIKSEKKTDLSTQVIINVTGNNIDNLTGQINFDNTVYIEGDEKYKLSVFDLVLEDRNGLKSIDLESDFVNASIYGQFKVLELQDAMSQMLYRYIPSAFPSKPPVSKSVQNFDYSFLFRKTDAVTRLFMPQLKIAPKTLLRGNYNSAIQQFTMTGNSDKISYSGITFKKWTVAANTTEEAMDFSMNSERLLLTDSLGLTEFGLRTVSHADSVNIGVVWSSRTEREYRGDVKSFLHFNPDHSMQFKILPSLFVISDSTWVVDKDNFIVVDTSYINLNKLAFEHGQQSIAVNGIISKNKNDHVKLKLDQFNLENINLFTSASGLRLKGVLDGESDINDVYHDFVLTSDFDFLNFFINDNEIGNGDVSSVWDQGKDALYTHGSFTRDAVPNILFSGYYYPKRDENNIDMEVNLQALRMQLLQPFVKDFCSDFEGLISGDVTIKGSLKKPDINGTVNVNASRVRVNYLNTFYKFNQDVIVENTSFGVENMTVYDIPNNNKAIVTGKVYHDNFKNFQLDIDIQANKFQCLNTSETDNSLYYGQAFVTGQINIFGFVNNEIRIDANVKTEKITSSDKSDKVNVLSKTELTKFYIPLGGTSEVSQNNFITFVKKDSTLKVNDNYKVSLGGLVLNFDLEVTPDAEIQLIFDQKVGDIIKARGSGNISMNISPKGDFKMYGDYVIENGDYLFTLQNIINKRFDIKKGSTIKWSGVPYKADLNIAAIYKARAPIKTFFPEDSTNTAYKKRYPVDVEMNMTGDLTDTHIDFEIGLPTLDAPTRQTILSYINNDAEVNRQVFSLLILNSFVTPYQLMNSSSGNGPNVANAAGANTSEMLSNQLSNMLSKISNDFDIGVNYRPGDAITKDELEVALSTQLFNDKLSIEGNIANNTNSQNPNNLVGDVNVDYKLTEDGKVRVKAFNKANDNSQTNLNGPYTQGVGVFYREEFDTIGALFDRYLDKVKPAKKEKPPPVNGVTP